MASETPFHVRHTQCFFVHETVNRKIPVQALV